MACSGKGMNGEHHERTYSALPQPETSGVAGPGAVTLSEFAAACFFDRALGTGNNVSDTDLNNLLSFNLANIFFSFFILLFWFCTMNQQSDGGDLSKDATESAAAVIKITRPEY